MQSTDQAEDLLSTKEAADLLGIDRSGIIRRVTANQLKPAKTLPGETGSHLFRLADILALQTPVDAGSSSPPGDDPAADAA